MTTSTVHLTDCPNCGAMLEGAFCAQCGQKVTPLNPSLHDFLHDLVHEFLHFDGKIFRSVRLLLTGPGFLSREHFEGRRARYVSPIRLYLIFSVVYFAVAAFAPSATFRVTITPSPGDSPEETARLEMRRQELQEKGSAAFTKWVPRAMFVLVPVFAGLVALAGRKSGRNYPQHLYFAMHVHAAWFFAGTVAAAAHIRILPVVTTVVPDLAGLYFVLYLVLAFRRAYNLTAGGAILRSVAVGTAYAIVVLAALGAILFSLGLFNF
jgi:hypothetical protein